MSAIRRRIGGALTTYLVYLRDPAGGERRIGVIKARNPGHAQNLARKAGYGKAVRVEPLLTPTVTPREDGSDPA